MFNFRFASRLVLSVLLLTSISTAYAASASIETPTIPSSGDADDPAVWLHPTDPSKSLVITSVKNAGLRVYNLSGNEVQSYKIAGKIDGQSSRLNNVDIQYNFKMADGTRADVAIFSERGQDALRVFKIDASNPTNPLTEITGYSRTFPNIPLANQSTAYGLGLWRDTANDKLYSLVAQRGGSGANGFAKGHSIAQFEMIAQADGTVTSQLVNSWSLPTTYKGIDLANDLDPTGDNYNPQSEGIVVDQQTGMLYVGQEDVGIWGIDLKSGALSSRPLIETKTFNASSPITPDVEGLTIRYGENGEGLIIASSQGDSTFAAFSRKDFSYLGSFTIDSNSTIDGVQHSDGADVTSFGLPGYEDGLFITQDGEDNGVTSGSTNFKYVKWSDIVKDNPFLAPYAKTPVSFNPRNIAPVPEPEAYAMLLVGLALVSASRKRQS